MKTINFQLSEEEDMLIRKYADLHHMEPSAFILETVLERIENEHASRIFDKVWEEEKDQERISHEQLKGDLGL